eukprot:CAMPEP_0172358922 /NCGR_PEP_ID=MMETSP1060-20121228/3198_1 /TAXON_ID=37318 /ORGANISM="Pseudo-nitzschia pungens, Strain cf. cingulata" /LENGTH=513 /DNA_ID=CAMNT_0013080361 /DNA_START=226 /DNA_END=1767 /DNA_ORIENTATION=+
MSPLSSSPPPPPSLKALDEAVKRVLQNNFDADSKTCILTLLKILDNVLQQPHNPKVRTLRTQNQAIRSRIVDRQGHHVLLACGFVFVLETEPGGIGMGVGIGTQQQQQQPEEKLVLHEDREDTELLVKARHTLARIAVLELGARAETMPKFHPPPPRARMASSSSSSGGPPPSGGFDVYKGNRFDGQSASVGTNLGPPANWKSKTEQELAELKRREEKLQRELLAGRGKNKNSKSNNNNNNNNNNNSQSNTPSLDRQWTVILPGQAASSGQTTATTSTATATSTTTSSSRSTRGDSQLLASHFQKQHASRAAAEQRGFTTKAMRELERLRKTKVYSHTQLALAFPDAVVIKANFATRETISAVLDGLCSEVLSPDVLPASASASSSSSLLELYQTPPRTVLDPSKNLTELGLVPAARIYVGWKRKPLSSSSLSSSSSSASPGWYLRPERLGSTPDLPAAMPTSVAVVGTAKSATTGSKSGAAANNNNNNNNPPRKKKTKAEKEAALMKRMLRK